MLRLLDPKTRIFFPSEEKEARFQAPLSSPAERNRARSAFKRFFPPKSLRKIEVLISLGQRLRVFDALSLIYVHPVITESEMLHLSFSVLRPNYDILLNPEWEGKR
jgi:hypothetical protein